jgi:hypothetical protein
MDDHITATQLDLQDLADFAGSDSASCSPASQSEYSPCRTQPDFDFEGSFDYDHDSDSRQSFFEKDFEEVYKESKALELEEKGRDELENDVLQLGNRAAMLEQLCLVLAENRALKAMLH